MIQATWEEYTNPLQAHTGGISASHDIDLAKTNILSRAAKVAVYSSLFCNYNICQFRRVALELLESEAADIAEPMSASIISIDFA